MNCNRKLFNKEILIWNLAMISTYFMFLEITIFDKLVA